MTRAAGSPSSRRSGPDAGRAAGEGRVRVRWMRPGDLPRVTAIEAEAFPVPWNESTFRRLLAGDRVRAWTALAPGTREVAGYAVMWFRERGAQLGNLAVAAGHRRRGIGRRLVRRSVEAARDSEAKHLILEVRESNDAALSLYRSLGFRLLGRRRDYYRAPPEDALVMGVDAR